MATSSDVQSPANPMRAHLHGMWSAVAGAWGEHAAYADERGAAVTELLLERAALRPGDRVLELACGPGGAGMAAAPLVAPGGEVVMSDVAAEMTAIAAARAAEGGLTNVSTAVLDLEAIAEPDATFDVVLCREGLMFALEPACAVAELCRVLRPGGRVAVAVWGARVDNPWLGIVFDVVSAQMGVPIPPPGIPGPFALGDSGQLTQLFDDSPLTAVQVTAHPTPLRAASFEEWWNRTSSLAGPLASILAGLPEDAAQTLQTSLRDAVAPYGTAGGLELPGLSLVASGRLAG